MSDQFSDHCKTCANSGTCKAKGCIDMASTLIDEQKAEIAELKKERNLKEKVIQVLCEGVHCNTCQCRDKCQAENEVDFMMDAACMNNRREWAIDKETDKEVGDESDPVEPEEIRISPDMAEQLATFSELRPPFDLDDLRAASDRMNIDIGIVI